MTQKVSQISKRKRDHIKINLEESVTSGIRTGLENLTFIHEALPEINLPEVDTSTTLFSKKLKAPLLISSMTGGTPEALAINLRLAESAQECGIAMGVGSQRAALEDPEQAASFDIRKAAPDILLFANLGAIQLNYGYGLSECERAVDMIGADVLYLHLNPLQEALQVGGDTQWKGLAKKIEAICKNLTVPVVVKEVGWGISEKTAWLLGECGVSAIDVAGAGGTSWSQVEMYSTNSEFQKKLAATFIDWGIPTAESIRNVKNILPDLPIIASGGLKDGLDVAKCVALGASLAGMAGPFLKAANVSTEEVVNLTHLFTKQIQISMFGAGVDNISALQKVKLRPLQ